MRRIAAAGLASGVFLVAMPAGAADLQPGSPPAAGAIRFDRLERGDDAKDTYELNALDLVHTVYGWSLFSPSEGWRPVRGKYRYAMTYVDFFESVGQPDLASAQARRNTLSDVLFYGGLVALAAGAGLAAFGGVNGESPETVTGVGFAGGGLVCAIVGGVLSGPLVDERDAAAMAKAYDHTLGTHLHLDGPSASSGPVALRAMKAVQWMAVRIRF